MAGAVLSAVQLLLKSRQASETESRQESKREQAAQVERWGASELTGGQDEKLICPLDWRPQGAQLAANFSWTFVPLELLAELSASGQLERAATSAGAAEAEGLRRPNVNQAGTVLPNRSWPKEGGIVQVQTGANELEWARLSEEAAARGKPVEPDGILLCELVAARTQSEPCVTLLRGARTTGARPPVGQRAQGECRLAAFIIDNSPVYRLTFPARRRLTK